jgi:hypothetical protein
MPEQAANEYSIAAGDQGRHNAAESKARGALTFAASSAAAATPILVGGAQAGAPIPVPRIHYIARRIHSLGERPLAELFIELAARGDLHGVLERYARLPPAADFIRAHGGDRLTSPRAARGGRR